MSKIEIETQLRHFFERNPRGLTCAYLFGSVARGEAGTSSDIDLAVLYESDPPPTLEGMGFELGGELERCLGKKVDLVVLNRAPPDLIRRVLQDGLLVFEGDASVRIRFEVRARAEYFDLLPYLQEYRRSAGKTG